MADTLESLTQEAGESPREQAAFIRKNRELIRRLPPEDFLRRGAIAEAQTPSEQAISSVIIRRLTGKTSPRRRKPDLIQRTMGAMERVREAIRRRTGE